METHKCEKDGKYIISTNSDCVVTDVETGIVLAVVLAKTQKVIQAISDSFTTSVECSVRPFVEATSDIDLIGGGEDDLPAGYKKLEYLESSGTQFIDTGIVTDGTYTIAATLRGNNVGGSNDIWGRRGSDGASFAQRFARTYWLIAFYYVWGGQLSENQLNSAQIHDYIVTEGQKRIIVDGKSFNLNALNLSEVNASNPSSKTHYLFAANGGNRGQVCFYSFRMADGEGNVVLDFVPVLDDTGTPCMFDKVSHQSYYNSGSGDFIYPVDEYDTQTLDLDDVVYGKMTEYGIRRLYKVPAGETMTLTDYALANGYKEIIESPMPTEGYWIHQWKETDTQLILEWVETEAPAEEV